MVKVGPRPRGPGPREPGIRDPGLLSKIKSGTLIIIFLYCLTYFVLGKYIYIYMYIYTNLPVSDIVRLPHPQSGDSGDILFL